MLIRPVVVLRIVLGAVLAVCLWTAAQAKADSSVQYLVVPSAAMGRSNAVDLLCPAQIWQLRNSAAGYQPRGQ
jgi:hypothetical protein